MKNFSFYNFYFYSKAHFGNFDDIKSEKNSLRGQNLGLNAHVLKKAGLKIEFLYETLSFL